MKLDAKSIILFVVVVVLLYFIYTYFFASKETILAGLTDARTQKTIQGGSLSSSPNANYSFSIWFYINDWNYRIGQPKVIFQRLGASGKPAPSVSLGANENNINVAIESYTNQTGATTINNCVINDVPLQRWTNLIMSVNGRALDLYIDGKLIRTCILAGPPKNYSQSALYVTPEGGFSGYTSKFQFFDNPLSPTEAYNIYKEGYGGKDNELAYLFNKYRLKLAFMEGNKEVNSFEI